jgi:hypothetical protein
MWGPMVRSLDDLATVGGITARFVEGSGTALGHHWQLLGQNGWLLARTVRVHNGGKAAQAFWKFLTVTGLDANNDIHLELRGADNRVLVRASSIYDKPAHVTVVDPAGNQVARSVREKNTFVVHGPDDAPLAELTCEGESPWPVRSHAGDVIGQLLAGEPGPSLSPSAWEWIDPQWALNSATYARTMHLGLRRVKRYSFAPTAPDQPPALALLPLLCGLTY